eukprot:12899910-Prorocentrum_lima.AAC.1
MAQASSMPLMVGNLEDKHQRPLSHEQRGQNMCDPSPQGRGRSRGPSHVGQVQRAISAHLVEAGGQAPLCSVGGVFHLKRQEFEEMGFEVVGQGRRGKQ